MFPTRYTRHAIAITVEALFILVALIRTDMHKDMVASGGVEAGMRG